MPFCPSRRFVSFIQCFRCVQFLLAYFFFFCVRLLLRSLVRSIPFILVHFEIDATMTMEYTQRIIDKRRPSSKFLNIHNVDNENARKKRQSKLQQESKTLNRTNKKRQANEWTKKEETKRSREKVGTSNGNVHTQTIWRKRSEVLPAESKWNEEKCCVLNQRAQMLLFLCRGFLFNVSTHAIWSRQHRLHRYRSSTWSGERKLNAFSKFAEFHWIRWRRQNVEKKEKKNERNEKTNERNIFYARILMALPFDFATLFRYRNESDLNIQLLTVDLSTHTTTTSTPMTAAMATVHMENHCAINLIRGCSITLFSLYFFAYICTSWHKYRIVFFSDNFDRHKS